LKAKQEIIIAKMQASILECIRNEAEKESVQKMLNIVRE